MKRISFLLLITIMMAACTRQPDEQESLEKFSRQVSKLQQGMSAKEAQWQQRFSSLPMGNVLVPDNLVAPEGRASGKATLKQFRALIAERAATREAGSIELQEIIAAIPDEDIRRSARAGLNARHEESFRSAKEMDQAQLQLANAYEAIVDWCEREGKRLTVQDNQLSLSTPAQQTQLNSLLSALDAAEKREDESVSQMEGIRQRSQRR